MTTGQIAFVLVVFFVCLAFLAWMFFRYRDIDKDDSLAEKESENREAVANMLARIDDVFSLKIHKQVYGIRGDETAVERKERPPQDGN